MNAIINTELKNALTTITTKEFIAIWKKIANSEKRKPTFTTEMHYGKPCKMRQKGFIYPEHHIIYNIVRGKPASRGFQENTEGYDKAMAYFKSNASNVSDLMYAPFEGHMSKETFGLIRDEVRKIAQS